jgi:hypothetical protein|tara:strand:- start:50 stop:286 length:237 start_codon:yes stop_codon:yes gene_type:complete
MNKVKLAKGIKNLVWSIFFGFSGPILCFQAFKNINHPFFWYVFILSIALMLTSIYFGYNGIRNITISLLGEKKKIDKI